MSSSSSLLRSIATTASRRVALNSRQHGALAMAAHRLPQQATTNLHNNNSFMHFSSKPESNNGIRGWMTDRAERKQQEKYMEQMERLSEMEVFTMANYKEELKRGLSGFTANIKFMQSKEVKMAKEVLAVVDTFIDVLGPQATAEDLIAMDRLQRLKVATAANKTLEEISIMVSQITNMDVMQKALRKRRLENKPIPPTQEAMQAAIKKDALQVLSKSQSQLMRGRQEEAARRMARKKRR